MAPNVAPNGLLLAKTALAAVAFRLQWHNMAAPRANVVSDG